MRIGEARPDFSERLEKERLDTLSTMEENDLKKKKRLARKCQGAHSKDMSLVTADNLRPGWKTTPLGRLIRPIRMRPLRPVGNPIDPSSSGVGSKKKKKSGEDSAAAKKKKTKGGDSDSEGEAMDIDEPKPKPKPKAKPKAEETDGPVKKKQKKE